MNNGDCKFQMKEDELILTHHVGEVINILQTTTHHLFDPDDLLTVRQTLTILLNAMRRREALQGIRFTHLIMQLLNENLIVFAGGI